MSAFLIDTQLLLWAAGGELARLAPQAVGVIADPNNALVFSAASIWEVAIKTGLGRPDFRVDAGVLRRGLLENDYAELAITGAHGAAVANLPPIHKDPFDRMLLAQAAVEGLTLLTADVVLGRYPGAIQTV